MKISARNLSFSELNALVKSSDGNVCIDGCLGQRYIGAGLKDKKITVYGTPGNALGAYLDGGEVEVYGNAQDAVGDTMNAGKIIIRGSAGDALGYAMRGGVIYIRDDAGYRIGIHMKEYKRKKPVIVIGNRTGSFLGEYLAGGLIIVLGLASEDTPVGSYAATGMHGGKICVRTDGEIKGLPKQVSAEPADDKDIQEILPYIKKYSDFFDYDAEEIMRKPFQVLKPNTKNPYHRLYIAN